jgi:hypothetical protein
MGVSKCLEETGVEGIDWIHLAGGKIYLGALESKTNNEYSINGSEFLETMRDY